MNYCVSFFPGFCVFQDLLTGKVRAIGNETEGLYTLQGKNTHYNDVPRKSLAVHGAVDVVTWHKRLGHVPMKVVRRISFFNNNSNFHLGSCDVFPLARQTRVPFPVSTTKSTTLFQLLQWMFGGLIKLKHMIV